MVSKIRSVVLIFVLVMLFSGGVHGKPLQEGVTIDGIYYGKGYDPESPNLLIGGIFQKSPNPNDNPDLKKLADDNQAIYIPTYYDPNLANFKETVLAVSDAALGRYSDFNGLNQLNKLKGEYNTVIAYSGGTATAITALEKQIVTCDTLILISPMAAGVPDAESKIDAVFTTDIMRYTGTGIGSQLMRENERSKIIEETKSVAKKNFEDQINKILSNGDSAAVKNIIVIQSKDDKLPEGDAFQYRFLEANDPNAPSWINKIEVNDIILGYVPNGHEAIFKTYAMNNIKDGACTDLGTPQPSTRSVVADTPRFEETTPVAADVNSIGTPFGDNTVAQKKQQPNLAATAAQARSDVAVLSGPNGDKLLSSIKNWCGGDLICDAANLVELGRYDDAVYLYQTIIERDPDSIYVWRLLGDALNKLGRTDEANAAFAKSDEVQKELENQRELEDQRERRLSSQEEENLVRRSGGAHPSHPSSSGSSGSSGGLSQEQKDAIKNALDSGAFS
jgi:tetratricopeptide (TPR) repeat protein